MLGITQQKLGEMIGLTFQQVQKYERGANRIGASSLYKLSKVLDVPVPFFFDDTDPVRAPAINSADSDPLLTDVMSLPETEELVNSYYQIDDPEIRARLAALAKALARGPQSKRRHVAGINKRNRS